MISGKQCAVLLSLRLLILGSRRIGLISSCTRGRAEVSELACPRCFSACMLVILASAVVGLRGPGASQPASLCSAFQPAGSVRCPLHTPTLSALLFRLRDVFQEMVERQEKQIQHSQLARSSSHTPPQSSHHHHHHWLRRAPRWTLTSYESVPILLLLLRLRTHS